LEKTNMSNGEFSVYWWDPDGNYHKELKHVSAEDALQRSKELANGPASVALGVIERIIITDGGDCTCFEWIKGKGVVFP
jgi:hypothetical protein